MEEGELIRETYIYHLDGADLRLFIEINYEENVAKLHVFANYLKDRIQHNPMLHVYFGEDEMDDDVFSVPMIPKEIPDEDADRISRVEYDHDKIVVGYLLDLTSTPILFTGTLEYTLPVERANTLIERLPDGLLRYHSKRFRKGKKVWDVVERFSE